MSSPKRFAVVALKQNVTLLSYWEAALKRFVTLEPSKREAMAPFYHWRQLVGSGYTIWISQHGYSSQDECNVVRIEMAPYDSQNGLPLFEGIIELALSEFHANVVLEEGRC